MSKNDTKQNIFTKLMSMDEATWQRHANPWSVWTRVVTGIPVVFFAVWSIKLYGGWSLGIIAISCLWLWLNPRLFPVPKNTNNWGSKATFGERVWLNRSLFPIPAQHQRVALFLLIVTSVGFVVGIVGAYLHLLLPMVCGGIISWFGKMWFCDRMVWLYDEMKDRNPEYASWLKQE